MSEIINNFVRVFCYWTGSQRHDDGHRRGQQWDSHSGGMAERGHEQHPFACSARTEGDVKTPHFKLEVQCVKFLRKPA